MPTDNPTHAELVKKAQSELSLFQRIGKQTSSDLLVCVLSLTAFIENQASRIEELGADNKRPREALTPSGDTKADYMGEFSFGITLSAGGEEDYRRIMVPWTTIKEIMAAIRARAALESVRDGV